MQGLPSTRPSEPILWLFWGPILLIPTTLALMSIAVPFTFATGWFWMGDFLYGFLRQFCHQMPSRSFWAFGYPFGTCIRSLSIYVTFVIVGVSLLCRSFPPIRVSLAVTLVLPMFIDVGLQVIGAWRGHNWIRGLSGMLFGIGSASLLWVGVSAVVLRVSRALSAVTWGRAVERY